MIEKLLRNLPSFRGKLRISRFFFKKEINIQNDIIVKGKYGCIYNLPNLKENIGFEIFINGVYEKESIEFISSRIPSNGTFIDIGANIGAICLPVSLLRPDLHLFSIEASTRVYNYLVYNLQKNKITNCNIQNNAVTDVDGENLNFYSPVDLFGKGSLSAVFTNEAENVISIKLDTLVSEKKITNVDFIKIDIEGYEYFAFKGGEKLLSAKNAPDILFEFTDWAEEFAIGCKPGDAQKLLMQYGYSLWKIGKNGKQIPMYKPLVKGSLMILASKKIFK